ncbi:MAG: lasso peptide biosynthesis B2 protein [Pseudomonadota bacterium]
MNLLLHTARIDEDLVILDLRSDSYFCAPRAFAEDNASPEPGTDLSRMVETALRAAGVEVPQGWRALDPPELAPARSDTYEPHRAVVGGGSYARLDANLRRAWRYASRVSFERLFDFPHRSLMSLTDGLAEARARLDRPSTDLRAWSQAFDVWSPWWPYQGECLYRAYVRLKFLHAGGHDAHWVFGVRLWPFQAHCWLQVGDLVIGDRVHRVRAFTPIMVA